MAVANWTLGLPPAPFIRYIKRETSGQYGAIHREAARTVDLVSCNTILTSTTAFSELEGDLSVGSHCEGGEKGEMYCVFWDGAQ